MSVERVDQGMAAAAAEILPQTVSKELRTRYRQLRVMMHTAGLAATYAFIAAKEGDENDLAAAYRQVNEGIRKRLVHLGVLPSGAEGLKARDVLSELGSMDMARYTRASADVAAFTGWLSRLADAVHQADRESEPSQTGER